MGFGDDLMVTGHIRRMQATDPRKVRIEYGKPLWSEVFDHNPRITRNTSDKNAVVYHPRVNGLRPYCVKKTDDKWTWTDYVPEPGELYFQPDELAFAAQFAPDVVIEPNIKSRASVNKAWGHARWLRLVELLLGEGVSVVQLGPQGTPTYAGVKLIETRSFRWAAAVLARARVLVTVEGGLHHAAAAVGAQAVVIYGGFISPRQTGYASHVNLFTGGTPCGTRKLRCPHCEAAMNAIAPKQVFEEAMRLRG